MMPSKYTSLLLLCVWLISHTAFAQTLSQARTLYNKGQYAEAKPMFERYLKRQPANGNYNLWYGVCCLETGDAKRAVDCLETAVRKRIPSGQLYLGQAYFATYRFEEGLKVLEDYAAELKRRKRDTALAEQWIEKCRMGMRLLRGVENVCVVDSMVMDKDSFLNAYRISPESGRIFLYNAYFGINEESQTTVYQTELGDKIFYAQPQATGMNLLLTSNRTNNGWGQGAPLTGAVEKEMNPNYPYMMADGTTLYYAAEGPHSLGGYDIFVTRLNSDNNTYLTPVNMGMPFNSPANDYMYVVDEFRNLGWFVSDRHQPEGKVCVYVFLPNASKQVYDYENISPEFLRRQASIHALKETWSDQTMVADALQRLKDTQDEAASDKRERDFFFVVDDRTIYTHYTDFKTPHAKELFGRYHAANRKLKQVQKRLDNLRMDYMQADKQKQKQMSPAMLDLEKRKKQLYEEKAQLAIEVRKAVLETP